MHRLLIAEDERKIARFLELELTHEGYDVTIAPDGLEASRLLEEETYDALLLDIMMPGRSGLTVLRRLRRTSDLPVILLTAKDDTTDIVTGLDAGADDYLTKPFAIEELLARLRRLLKRQAPDRAILYRHLTIAPHARRVQVGDEVINLTKKEYDLLYYLVTNRNVALDRDRILREVWGYDYAGDTNVVDVYVRYLRQKLSDPYDQPLIETIRGVGYMCHEDH
jgi:DNA-binding response OmpR family regulator